MSAFIRYTVYASMCDSSFIVVREPVSNWVKFIFGTQWFKKTRLSRKLGWVVWKSQNKNKMAKFLYLKIVIEKFEL